MTQQQQQRQKVAPRPPEEHSDWRMDPSVAAGVAAFWALFLVMILRWTSTPGWYVLLATLVLAVASAWAGVARKPRALSARSIAFRFVAMIAAGQWMFWQTADTALTGGGAALALVAQPLLVLAVAIVLFVGARLGQVWWAVAVAAIALVAGEGVMWRVAGGMDQGIDWIGHVLTHAAPLRNRAELAAWLWPNAAFTLFMCAAVAAVLGAVFAHHEAEVDAEQARLMALKSSTRERLRMQNLLWTTVHDKGLEVTDVKPWTNGAGEDYIVKTSNSNTTWKELNNFRDTLASKEELPIGCGFESVTGSHRGEAVLAVSRVNKLADQHRYPRRYRMRTIYDPIPCGVLRDGTETGLELRENSVFVAGQKRSGKTTTLQDIMAGCAQCTDAMIWVIDFNDGGVALPFLYAWAEGRADVPMIDWVAPNVAEAQKMADVALRIATDRKVYYKHKKRKANKNLLPLDSDLPEIVIIMDEGAETMGDSVDYDAAQVRKTLEKIQRVAGDSGVNIIFSGLRATSDVADPAFKKGFAARIGMRVSDSEELGYLFGDYRLSPEDAPYQGSGFILPGHEHQVRVFKAYYLDPEQMDEIAVHTGGGRDGEPAWRPKLDDRGIELGGKIYHNRWVRTKHLLQDEDGNVLVAVGSGHDEEHAATSSPSAPAPVGPGGPAEPGDRPDPKPFIVPGSPEKLMGRADELLEQLRGSAAPAGEPPTLGPDGRLVLDEAAVEARLAGIEQALDWNDAKQWPEPAPPPDDPFAGTPGPGAAAEASDLDDQKVLERLIWWHGPDGITTDALHLALVGGGDWGRSVKVSKQTMHNWLKLPTAADPETGYLAKREPRQPYVHRTPRAANTP